MPLAISRTRQRRRRRALPSIIAATIAAAVSVSASAVETASPALASVTTQATDTPIVVLFKAQPASVPSHDARAAVRTQTIDAVQAPVLRELTQVQAQHLRSFHVLNA